MITLKCSHTFVFVTMSLPISNNNSESLVTSSQPPSISVPNSETGRLSVALPRTDDDNAIQQATISQLDASSSSQDEVVLSRVTPTKPKFNYADVHNRSGPTVRLHNIEVDSVEIGCKLSKVYQCYRNIRILIQQKRNYSCVHIVKKIRFIYLVFKMLLQKSKIANFTGIQSVVD